MREIGGKVLDIIICLFSIDSRVRNNEALSVPVGISREEKFFAFRCYNCHKGSAEGGIGQRR